MSTSTRRRILPEALLGNRVDEFECPDALVRGDLAATHPMICSPVVAFDASSGLSTTYAFGISPASSSGARVDRGIEIAGG